MSLTFEPIAVPLRFDETGTVRVSGTRVTLDTVLGAYLRGDSPEQIAEGFPSLSVADIYSVLSYYLRHRAEVDTYLEQREHEAAAIRALIESDPTYWELRERVKARKAAMEATPRAAPDHG